MQIKKGLTSLVAFLVVASVGFILVLAIVKIGKLNTSDALPSETMVHDRQIDNLKSLGTSDAPADIAKDLDDTDLNSLDVELNKVSEDAKDL